MLLLLLAAGAGCPSSQSGTCQTDAECGGGDVCARTSECLPASAVHLAKVSWTIHGMTADATTCAATPDFYIQFYSSYQGDTFGYEPVPCMAGRFTVDKLPTRYVEVELGVTGGVRAIARLDASGNATLDLTP